jgi:hypothetical protein
MPQPRYSIVVPTRHRPQTLRATLATIVSQAHDSFEVVVADNASGPETRRVVEDLACPRLTYLRSDTPLSMSANWERALAAARGEWITFIGDDDGLLPGALADCDDLIDRHRVRAIHQHYGVYIWPCADASGEADRLQLHLGRGEWIEESHDVLAATASRPGTTRLPLPYHGWIHRSLFEQATRSGPVFQGKDPDTYAGILLAAMSDSFLTVERAVSLIGISGTSNTFRSFVIDAPGALQQDGESLNAAAGHVRHPSVPDVPVSAAVILDGLFKVGDRLGRAALPVHPTPLDVARHCAAGIWRTDAEGDRQLARVREKLSAPADLAAFDAAVAAAPRSGQRPRMVCIDQGRLGPYLVCDTARLGVRTVHEAATAAAAILDASRTLGLDAYADSQPPPRPHLFKRLRRRIRWKAKSWLRTAGGR